MDIKDLPKGALPDPEDHRDLVIPPVAMGMARVDWSKEYRLPVPPGIDQGSSDACVGCAWSYYHWQLKKKQFSVRDLFCRIYLDYGAYIRDGGVKIVNEGQADHNEVNDPNPMSMASMRSTAGTNASFRADDKEYRSFVLPDQSIDGVAWGVQEYSGVVFGVTGSNPGWANMLEPRPPQQGEAVWGHALYAMGYHMHSGRKCIIAMSSWQNSVKEHHIKEDYFYAMDATFNAWTLIPKEQAQMYITKKVKFNGSYGAMVITPNMVNITLAEDEPEWRSYSKSDSYGIHSVNSDNSTDWSVDGEINI